MTTTVTDLLADIEPVVRGWIAEQIGDNAASNNPGDQFEFEFANLTDGAIIYYNLSAYEWNNSTGTNVYGIGAGCGGSITTGRDNVLIGDQAGAGLTDADDNVFIGEDAGRVIVNSNYNTYIGSGSGSQVLGPGGAHEGHNVGIGFSAGLGGANATYNYGTLIGSNAGRDLTSGSSNVFVGYSAGRSCTTADSCIYIGLQAGYWQTTADYLLLIGSQTANNAADELTKTIIVGGMDYTTADQWLRINASLFMPEKASALADVATYGQVWVKNTTPNELWFTDDAGTDFQLSSAAPDDPQYVTLAVDGTLTNERVLTPGSGIAGTDGGVGSTYTLDLGALTANWDAGSYVITAAGFIVDTTAGYDVTPGSDTDTDLITLNVSATPRLWWDESASAAVWTQNFAIGASGASKLYVTGSGDVDIGVDNTNTASPIHLVSRGTTYRELTAGWGGLYTDSTGNGILFSLGGTSQDYKFVVNAHQDIALTINQSSQVDIYGPTIIDVTNTEAFLVRVDSDGGDVFKIDTTNSYIYSLGGFAIGASAPVDRSIYVTNTISGAGYVFAMDFRPTLTSSGNNIYGLYLAPTVTIPNTKSFSGINITPVSLTVSAGSGTYKGLQITQPVTTTGTVGYSYGIIIDNITHATYDYAIKTGLGKLEFGDYMSIDQASTTGAQPVLLLDQADISEGFINHVGTSAASAAGPISSWTAGNTIQGFVRTEINGAQFWIPYYDAPTS